MKFPIAIKRFLRKHLWVPPIITASHIPAVSVAIVREGRVLLVRRGRAPSQGVYAFPGGRVEADETLEAAARRELMEETSLSTGRLEPYAVEIIEPEITGAPAFQLTVFVGESAEGVLHAGDDADAAGWYTAQDLETLPVIASVSTIARELLSRT